MRQLLAAAVVLSIGAGCGDDTSETAADGGAGAGGEGGAAPALQLGVPSDACGVGFVHDGDFGCRAVLPTEACPPGAIAVPGDDSCRPVADCGSDTWGDIPIESNTQHVDQSYTGGASDGTPTRPWTTVQAAVDAATSGAIVAVAAGSYAEHVFIDSKVVRLWGRCPELVRISGPTGAQASIQLSRADGCEVHNLSVQSDVSVGIVVSGAQAALLDAVWIHDNGEPAVQASDTVGLTQVTIANSLIETSTAFGVIAAGADVTLERSAIRDTRIGGPGERGRGLLVTPHPNNFTASTVRVSGSLFERNHDANIAVVGGELQVSTTAVRDSLSYSGGLFGFGVLAQSHTVLGSSAVTIEASTFERCRMAGLATESSSMSVRNTSIRDTLSQQADGRYGRGVQAQTRGGARAVVDMASSLVTDNRDIGVFAIDADVTVNTSVVRRTTPDGPGRYGDGVSVMTSELGATGRITGSLMQDNARAGVSNFGAEIAIGDNVLTCNVVQLNGETQPRAFSYDDLGGNLCDCADEPAECRVLSTGLEPPAAL